MYKACIFDLDGTLANTVESIAYVANKVLKKFGYDPLPTERFYRYCGEGGRKLMERCLRDCGDIQMTHLDEGEKLYIDIFAENPLYHVVPYEGMVETLKRLKEQGVFLAVCTNKPHQAAVETVEGIFGPGLFDGIQGQCETVRRKPAPDAPMWEIPGRICRRARLLECTQWECSGDFVTGRSWKRIMRIRSFPGQKNCWNCSKERKYDKTGGK